MVRKNDFFAENETILVAPSPKKQTTLTSSFKQVKNQVTEKTGTPRLSQLVFDCL